MILVTGATGFIGSHLVARLGHDGNQVLGVSRYEPRDETRFLLRDCEGVNFLRINGGDDELIDSVVEEYSPHAIIHLDANVNPPRLQHEPHKAVQENFLTTFQWLAASVRHNVKRFILASSVGVLPRIQYEPLDASHPLLLENEGPGSGFYGASKAACELFGLSFRTGHGLEFSAIRCSAVFGFGMQWPIGIKPVLDAIVDGEPAFLSRCGPPRDYTPVDYITEIFQAAALLPEAPPGILYGATGHELVTPTELNETMMKTFPSSTITITEENADPEGIESLYRGVIDMRPTKEALGVGSATTLSESLSHAVSLQREFVKWRELERQR